MPDCLIGSSHKDHIGKCFMHKTFWYKSTLSTETQWCSMSAGTKCGYWMLDVDVTDDDKCISDKLYYFRLQNDYLLLALCSVLCTVCTHIRNKINLKQKFKLRFVAVFLALVFYKCILNIWSHILNFWKRKKTHAQI